MKDFMAWMADNQNKLKSQAPLTGNLEGVRRQKEWHTVGAVKGLPCSQTAALSPITMACILYLYLALGPYLSLSYWMALIIGILFTFKVVTWLQYLQQQYPSALYANQYKWGVTHRLSNVIPLSSAGLCQYPEWEEAWSRKVCPVGCRVPKPGAADVCEKWAQGSQQAVDTAVTATEKVGEAAGLLHYNLGVGSSSPGWTERTWAVDLWVWLSRWQPGHVDTALECTGEPIGHWVGVNVVCPYIVVFLKYSNHGILYCRAEGLVLSIKYYLWCMYHAAMYMTRIRLQEQSCK